MGIRDAFTDNNVGRGLTAEFANPFNPIPGTGVMYGSDWLGARSGSDMYDWWKGKQDTSDIVGKPTDTDPRTSSAISRLAGQNFAAERANYERNLIRGGMSEAAAAAAGARFQAQNQLNNLDVTQSVMGGLENRRYQFKNAADAMDVESPDVAYMNAALPILGG